MSTLPTPPASTSACNKILRATVHLWANHSRESCVWAEAYHQQKKQSGKSHAAALRCLGQRWLKILFSLWKNHHAYDEPTPLRNQVRHGSWVVQLLPNPTPSPA